MGDFNARTGGLSDLVANDKCGHIPLFQDINDDSGIQERASEDRDKRICIYGIRLIELCVSTGLKIANDSVLGDTSGRLTCHTHNGSSPVYYMLVDTTMLSKLRYLRAHDFVGDITDHCMVSIGASVIITKQIELPKGTTLPKMFKCEGGTEPQIKNWLQVDPGLPELLDSKMTNTKESLESINALLTRVSSKCLAKKGRRSTCKHKPLV